MDNGNITPHAMRAEAKRRLSNNTEFSLGCSNSTRTKPQCGFRPEETNYEFMNALPKRTYFKQNPEAHV